MFKGTRKAFERAPRWISGQHVTDPEIQIWTKDFHAAKVALNSIDRAIQEQELHEAEFLRLSLDLYQDFVVVRNCDQTDAVSSVPSTMATFAPIQSAVDEIKMKSHTHSVKMHKDLDEIRSLLHTVENLVHKTDRKKIDCEAVAHKQNIDYDDPASQDIPEIKTYLQFHYHVVSLVPQVLKQLDIALSGLAQRQLGHQMFVYKTAQAAIATVLADLQLPSHIDSVDILRHWSSEIKPVVEALSKTKTIGSVAVMPPHPTTWQKVKHTPDSVAHGVPSAAQTKQFASNVGNSFHHGISYIYPHEAKFFNPHKGIFGEKEEYELKLASEGKEVESTQNATKGSAKEPTNKESDNIDSLASTPHPDGAMADKKSVPDSQAAGCKVASEGVSVHSPEVPADLTGSQPIVASTATSAVPSSPTVLTTDVSSAKKVDLASPQPSGTLAATSGVPASPTVLTTEETAGAQPVIDSSREVLAHTGISGPARASETPSLSSVDEHPKEGTSLPTSAKAPLPVTDDSNPDYDELL